MFEMSSRWGKIATQSVLTVLAVVFAAPLFILFRVSLQGEGLRNYWAVLSNPLIPSFFLNTVIIASCTIVIVFVASMLSAYAFSKLPMRGKWLLYNANLIGLMIPVIALLVPLFITIKNLGLFNNYLAIIGPVAAFSIPFNLILVRNFFNEIPDSLLEAAKIDGCNSLKALLFIMIPLSKPISIVVVIWTFLSSWNEYLLALIFMRDENMRVITQAPQFFMGQYTQDVGKIFASLVLICLPVIIAYLFLQRYFEDGMTSGSIK